MEALAIEMEEMVLQLESFKDPSSSADGASASGADAGHDAAREKEIRAAWEELFANSMADIPTEAAAGGGGGGKSDVPGEPKDAFQKIRDEAAERLRKSDAEQVRSDDWLTQSQARPCALTLHLIGGSFTR